MRHFPVVLVFLAVLPSAGQETAYMDLVKAESRLQHLFTELYAAQPVALDTVLDDIRSFMPHALSLEGAMEYPWNNLDKIGVVMSEDGQVRVFTWHVQDNPDTYRYFGYIQVAGRKNRFEVIPLENNGKTQRGLFNVDQSAEDWYGKLYYGVVTKKVKRKTWYTLLGMDFNDSRSNMKFVEMISLKRNRVRFEKECFSNNRQRFDRVVLEYSDQVAISVRYDPRLEMIVYDHLVPFHPLYENQFEFYGPDGSYDGLRFEDGLWILQEDVDARMPD